MLLEMQTGNLDSDTNCTSPDKDKITSVNITDDSFIPVNNSKHKRNYDENKKNRGQNKEKTNTENADQELSDINQNGNQHIHIQIGVFQKINSCLSETYTVIQLRRIYTNCLV